MNLKSVKGYDLAIKEDIQAIKQEIGAEEQFLESMIKGERFFKKYKHVIIGAVTLGIVIVVGYYINVTIEQERLNSTNEAYEVLLKNPKDEKSLAALKDGNKPLYEAFLFQQASKSKNMQELKELLNSSLDPLLKDVAKFKIGNGDSELFKNIKILLNGYEFLKKGDTKKANAAFSSIPLTSNLQEIVKKLNHYQGIK